MSTVFFARFWALLVLVFAAHGLKAQTTTWHDFRTVVVGFFEKNPEATVGHTIRFLRDRYGNADVVALEQHYSKVKYYQVTLDSAHVLELRPERTAPCHDTLHDIGSDSCRVFEVTIRYRQQQYQESRSFSMYCPLLPKFTSMKDSVSIDILELTQRLDQQQGGGCKLQDYLHLLDGLGWKVKKVGYSEPDLYINGVRVVYQNGMSVAFIAKNMKDVKGGKGGGIIENNKDMFVQSVSFIMPNEVGYLSEFLVYRSSCVR